MLNLTAFKKGVIVSNFSRDHRLLFGTKYEIFRSQRDRLVQYVDLDLLYCNGVIPLHRMTRMYQFF